MSMLISTPPGNCHPSGLHFASPVPSNIKLPGFHSISSFDRTNLSYSLVRNKVSICATTDETNTQAAGEQLSEELKAESIEKSTVSSRPTSSASIDKDIKKVVQKTASTFAPRASMASKNPAVPGTALYTVFGVQGYASMLLGGVLSFNLLFPSNEPDIWRLMGMWSIWMFTIPSLRARDCSKNEKEALNYLFLLIPLLNVVIPFFWKSFPVVWTADTIAFFGMYAWKFGWLQRTTD
ncbi:protein RESISTANCE TO PHYTOPHTHORA 1, chloroplastic [Prosopis cineraria]|uniref:protein RESISTANCE TO PHYTOPHTHORA 1, chloroplastic n=1 Tax=Prosopis cineraria TaxID=364024 RepID=UPI00240EA9E2|nr:protein RESISTANCE TO PHYTOPHTHORA 1, chloroplastic [Prosopis cineraria]